MTASAIFCLQPYFMTWKENANFAMTAFRNVQDTNKGKRMVSKLYGYNTTNTSLQSTMESRDVQRTEAEQQSLEMVAYSITSSLTGV